MSNEVVLVEGLGVYQCNNSTITQIYNDGRNVSGAVLGEIRMFYGDAIPTGWLELDGSTFDANAFPLLYSFLGTNKVPDYREMALRGGTPVGVFSNDAMGNHSSHTVSGTGSHTHCLSAGSSHSHTATLGAIQFVDPCWRMACGTVSPSVRWRPTDRCCDTYYTGYCTVSASVTSNTSGITVGNSPWASTVTRAREVGVRYIIFAGA